jgi:hypothetical protein
VSDIDLRSRPLLVDEGVREPGARLKLRRRKAEASERPITTLDQAPTHADAVAQRI